jgi:hypothetical protein
MEIIHLINNTYQVIDTATDSVLFQGSEEDCQLFMYAEEEKRLYRDFLLMTGI